MSQSYNGLYRAKPPKFDRGKFSKKIEVHNKIVQSVVEPRTLSTHLFWRFWIVPPRWPFQNFSFCIGYKAWKVTCFKWSLLYNGAWSKDDNERANARIR